MTRDSPDEQRTINSYSELLAYLEAWTSWEDPDVYDFGGIVGVLGACLTNLERNALDAELEDIANRLEPGQLETLLRMADLARANPAEDEP